MFIELYHLLLYTHRVQPFSMRLKMTWNVTVRSCIKFIAVEKISPKKKKKDHPSCVYDVSVLSF